MVPLDLVVQIHLLQWDQYGCTIAVVKSEKGPDGSCIDVSIRLAEEGLAELYELSRVIRTKLVFPIIL